MNYGKDDLEIFKKIVSIIDDQEIIDYLKKMIDDWDGFLTLVQMFDNRIDKIQDYYKTDVQFYNNLKSENKRLLAINKELVNTIAKIGII